jgi:hypothetical protein
MNKVKDVDLKMCKKLKFPFSKRSEAEDSLLRTPLSDPTQPSGTVLSPAPSDSAGAGEAASVFRGGGV